MVSTIDDVNQMKKMTMDLHQDNSRNHGIHKSSSPLSSILKMMDNIQSELLQAQIDLQDGQHQIHKIETIFQSDKKNINVSNLMNSVQIIKNNDIENNKITELKKDIFVIQNDNRNIKKHLESVLSSNSQLQNGIVLIENELKKKDQLIQSTKRENKKYLLAKKILESNIAKLNNELNVVKIDYDEKLASFNNKVYSRELTESKYQSIQEDLKKQLKEAENKVIEQEKSIICYKDRNANLENQIEFAKRSVKNGIQSYEIKVKTIIEEIKTQKQLTEEENQKLTKELETSKKETLDAQEQCELLSLKLINKDDEIFQLKSKLSEKNQLEEREKLFKRELDENINQIRNYKTQIINLNSEKETFYNKICEQDNAICKLIDEIRSLHNQMKTVKSQTYEQNVYNESTYSSTAERPNQSTPISQSTTADLNEPSQSPAPYFNDNVLENCGDNDRETNELLNNSSEFDIIEDNTIKKLASLLKGQTECTKNYLNACNLEDNYHKKEQDVFVIDGFSKYLEEELKLIKIDNERNVRSIKRELTIK